MSSRGKKPDPAAKKVRSKIKNIRSARAGLTKSAELPSSPNKNADQESNREDEGGDQRTGPERARLIGLSLCG